MKKFVNPQAKYFNAFNVIGGIGPIAFGKLLDSFNSLEEAWTASTGKLSQIGLGKSIIEKIAEQRPKINPDLEMEKLGKEKIRLITIQDKNYPTLLKEIYSPPALLYIRGEISSKNSIGLGIVGSRQLSFYGQQTTPLFAAELARAGLTIISGLAKGIDTLAHQAALEVGGRTIAVLGCGIDDKSVYPYSNRRLAEEIVENGGVVISEFPIGTQPLPQHFPQRNRIISGLSKGVLVIEATKKSGALITARDALEQNRDVFAVPGSVFAQNSFGPNNLIKMGAKLVSQADDILQEFNLTSPPDSAPKNRATADSSEEKLILKQLSREPVHIDKIISLSKLSTAAVSSTLTMMEIKGKIKNLGRGNYVLAN
ncbi:MAG: DNA-processing protein DprA [Patescibacteria group bacterium]|nr:DNA-processing protein DprA [Patescibacteria group bacterium]